MVYTQDICQSFIEYSELLEVLDPADPNSDLVHLLPPEGVAAIQFLDQQV